MRSGLVAKFAARYQPDHDQSTTHNYIELINDEKIIRATRDLEGVWIIWWFDKNPNWRPLVRPPRGDGKRKGVFSTRAPYRPNPIGITATTLKGIDGHMIHVGDVDLIDGTTILDIKPYLPVADSFPESKIGWLQHIEEATQLPPSFHIKIEDRAQQKLDWLKDNFQVDFLPRASEMLSRDPSPHRTRRVVKIKENQFRMGCGAWRLFFHINNNFVVIDDVDKGYPDELLDKPGYQDIADRDAQIMFTKWFSSSAASK